MFITAAANGFLEVFCYLLTGEILVSFCSNSPRKARSIKQHSIVFIHVQLYKEILQNLTLGSCLF